jgi:lipopolysaccharide/colanic/teichoic acid biosynthesis glycosyltransferase
MIKTFDLLFSFLGLLFLFPLFFVIAIWIKIDSKGSIFYFQKRVGKNSRDFNLIKFRSMYINTEHRSLLTIGNNDNRITNAGKFIRKYKIDELPQLLNVIKGDMSIVGPRPEVRKYVNLYNENQKQVLSILPGITDYASIKYFNENEILASAKDPETEYIQIIMPHKIELNLKYISSRSATNYLVIIIKTIFAKFHINN